MVSVDLNIVNAEAPYEVRQGRKPLFFSFKTDAGIEYEVSFEPCDLMLEHESYLFNITNGENEKSPRDAKLRDTVIAVIRAFFISSQNVMLYLCDTEGNKQSMRSRLFAFWFEKAHAGDMFTSSTATIIDEDEVENYATIILRLDHPDLHGVLIEFRETAQLLNAKP